MDLNRNERGQWSFSNVSDAEAELKPDYIEALPRYLTIFDPLFDEAQRRSEADFVHTLIPVFSLQGPGWDAFETTVQAVEAIVELVNRTPDFVSARHLKLWLWGHIVEASAPYEQLARLLATQAGQRPRVTHFPADERGRPQSPWRKIEFLEAEGQRLGFERLGEPLREIWDGPLRNAVFHADYSLYGGEVRIVGLDAYAHEKVERLVARANAYHDALRLLRDAHIQSYDQPKRIPAGGFTPDPEEEFVVIVREGHGAVGLKDGHTREELEHGAIPFRLGIFTPEEQAMLEADPERAFLPRREA